MSEIVRRLNRLTDLRIQRELVDKLQKEIVTLREENKVLNRKVLVRDTFIYTGRVIKE